MSNVEELASCILSASPSTSLSSCSPSTPIPKPSGASSSSSSSFQVSSSSSLLSDIPSQSFESSVDFGVSVVRPGRRETSSSISTPFRLTCADSSIAMPQPSKSFKGSNTPSSIWNSKFESISSSSALLVPEFVLRLFCVRFSASATVSRLRLREFFEGSESSSEKSSGIVSTKSSSRISAIVVSEFLLKVSKA